MPFLFFFSYARDDWKGNYLEKFYEELVEEVRFISGHPPADVGFRDKEGIEFGSSWPNSVAEGLACCKTFVPVFTPTYFTRPYCGREWWCFRSRVERYVHESAGQAPSLILPVLWSAPHYLPEDLPEHITDIQLTHEDLGSVYNKEGLLQLMKQGRKRQKEYDAFVQKFAEKLVAASRHWTLAADRPFRLKEAKNVFELGRSQAVNPEGSGKAAGAGPGSADRLIAPDTPAVRAEVWSVAAEGFTAPALGPCKASGPRYAHFVFVAANRGELSNMASIRDHAAYDDEGAFWKPYLPPRDETIFTVATYTARRLRLTPIEIPVDCGIDELLDRARAEETIVVIIVDPWTLLLPRYADLMSRCDRVDLYNCAILIAWNHQDPQTQRELESLTAEARRTFASKWSNRPANFYHDAATSLESFCGILATALTRAQSNIIQARGYARAIRGDGPNGIPMITATLPR
jgi:FxsC-like protein